VAYTNSCDRTLHIGDSDVIEENVELSNPQPAASCADRIMETISPHTVASASTGPDFTALFQTVRELSCQMADLSRQVASLTAERNHPGPRGRQFRRPRSSSRHRSSSRGNPVPGGDANNGWCYYHRRFRDQAQRCTQPCSYTTQGN
jgi:hypothetical protein